MRVAIWHNLPSGGGILEIVDHVENLLERGHEVEVFCPNEARHEEPAFPASVPVNTLPLGLLSRGRRWSPTPPAPVILDRIRALRRHGEEAARRINEGHFDVLYAGACRYTRAPSVARNVNIPSLLYLGEPYRWLYEALPTLPLAHRPRQTLSRPALAYVGWHAALRSQARFELSAASAFDRILVNSRFSRESVLRAYGLEARVCRLGINLQRLDPVQEYVAKQRQVIGIGAIVPEKRVLMAIDAVALLAEPRPRLLWVGNVSDPAYAAACEAAAKGKNVDLRLRAGISDEHLATALRESQLMVYAPRLEPFGYAPLEAAAAGLPVVGVAEGGVRETIVDGVTGLLVEGGASALAAAIDTLLANDGLRSRLGRQGRATVERDWAMSDSIDRLERHLFDVVDGRRAKCRV